MNYEFLTVEEIAKILKVTKMTIYRYIKAGKLTAYKIGKDFRISKETLDNFLKQARTTNGDNKKN